MSSTNIIFNYNVMRMSVKSIQGVDQTRMNSLNTLTCIEGLSLWMASNRFKLNPDKTEVMWLTSRGRQHLIGYSSIIGHGINIKLSSTLRQLKDYYNSLTSLPHKHLQMFFLCRVVYNSEKS